MQQLLLLSLVSVSSSLKCKDIIIGEIGGTSFNFVNTLKCPAETKWCMNVNVSFNSLIDGLFGNCETNGLIKPLLNFTTVFGDISCKAVLEVFSRLFEIFLMRPNQTACYFINSSPSFNTKTARISFDWYGGYLLEGKP
ncbi:hypothetical protein GCK32_005237 [Trichostrongylus colubriformis]|uniref:Uncharacterized protein n=1 Tax=Trichostrongylus colubriformis TaxID=6319 RepID=A0AAN8FS22_TRICO